MRTDKYKNFKLFKLIQLILLILFGIMFFCYLSFDPLLKNNIYSNKNLLTICVFLWAFMLYSVVCLVADFSQLEKEIIEGHTLKQTAYLDSLTGLPNRNACDMMISKYTARENISDFGCIHYEIYNIEEINTKYNRLLGNMYLRDFASILEKVANKYGFLGRNSGNDFLIVIENCNEEIINSITQEINIEIDKFNKNDKDPKLEIISTSILNSEANQANFLNLLSALYAKRTNRNRG